MGDLRTAVEALLLALDESGRIEASDSTVTALRRALASPAPSPSTAAPTFNQEGERHAPSAGKAGAPLQPASGSVPSAGGAPSPSRDAAPDDHLAESLRRTQDYADGVADGLAAGRALGMEDAAQALGRVVFTEVKGLAMLKLTGAERDEWIVRTTARKVLALCSAALRSLKGQPPPSPPSHPEVTK